MKTLLTRQPPHPEPRLEAEPRSAERVRTYLDAEFSRSDRKDGTRLPSIRQLAKQLNVSTVTVHHVFQQLAKEGCIRTEVGNGTFLLAPTIPPDTKVLRMALNIPLLDITGGQWGYQIAQGVLRAAAQAARRLMILPLRQPPPDDAAMTQTLLEERDLVDGIILFPSNASDPIRRAYEEAGKPVVEVNPPAIGATVNFVSPDYYDAGFRLGQAWRRAGRQRVILLAPGPLSVSAHLRGFGLMAGLEFDGQGGVSFQLFKTASVLEENGYQAMRQALARSQPAPDAVGCSGDLLALGAIRALREAGLRIPQDVSVAGGTGMDLSGTSCPRLTHTRHPFEKMGERLVALLVQRIERKGAAVPGEVLPVQFIGGATTRPEENAQLGIAPSKHEPREMEGA